MEEERVRRVAGTMMARNRKSYMHTEDQMTEVKNELLRSASLKNVLEQVETARKENEVKEKPEHLVTAIDGVHTEVRRLVCDGHFLTAHSCSKPSSAGV